MTSTFHYSTSKTTHLFSVKNRYKKAKRSAEEEKKNSEECNWEEM